MDVLVLMQVATLIIMWYLTEMPAFTFIQNFDWIKNWKNFCYEQEPVLPGTFLRARAIGLMPMIDQVEVALYSYLYFILFGEMKKSRVRVFGRGGMATQ